MQTEFLITLLLLIISSTLAEIGWGRCPIQPTPSVVQDFDIGKYINTWYEYARDKYFYYSKGDCVTATYTLNEDKTIEVKNSEYTDKGELISAIGKARCPNKDGKCKVSFGSNWTSWLTEVNYWVLDTDYSSYSVVYSCPYDFTYGFRYTENLWILLRSKEPTTEALSKVESVLQRIKISKDRLRVTKQGGSCVYEGDTNTNSSVNNTTKPNNPTPHIQIINANQTLTFDQRLASIDLRDIAITPINHNNKFEVKLTLLDKYGNPVKGAMITKGETKDNKYRSNYDEKTGIWQIVENFDLKDDKHITGTKARE